MSPTDITVREAARVLDLLSADDRETIEAYLYIERRLAVSRVEWGGTIIGAAVFGILVGGIVVVGSIDDAATKARADDIKERCVALILEGT